MNGKAIPPERVEAIARRAQELAQRQLAQLQEGGVQTLAGTRRRRPGRERPKCIREGCYRRAARNVDTCSQICWIVHNKLEEAERLCRSLGPCAESVELWSSITSVNDALTGQFRAFGEAKRALVGRAGGLLAS